MRAIVPGLTFACAGLDGALAIAADPLVMMIDDLPAPSAPTTDPDQPTLADLDLLDAEPWPFDFRSFLDDPE